MALYCEFCFLQPSYNIMNNTISFSIYYRKRSSFSIQICGNYFGQKQTYTEIQIGHNKALTYKEHGQTNSIYLYLHKVEIHIPSNARVA